METPYDRLVAQIVDTPLTRLTRQTIQAQQARLATISGTTAAETATQQFLRAQQDRLAAVSTTTAAETATEQFVRAQQDRLSATGQAGVDLAAQRFAVDVLGPLTRRLSDASQQRVDGIAQSIASLQLRMFEDVDLSDFVGVLDRDDAVDQLVTSPRLRSAVRGFVESDAVRDLVGQIDTDDLSEADADEVADHTSSVVLSQSRVDQLTPGQIVTIFTAIDLLVIAAVAAVYGYDVGVIADVLAWPLAALGVYGFVAYVQDSRKDD